MLGWLYLTCVNVVRCIFIAEDLLRFGKGEAGSLLVKNVIDVRRI